MIIIILIIMIMIVGEDKEVRDIANYSRDEETHLRMLLLKLL